MYLTVSVKTMLSHNLFSIIYFRIPWLIENNLFIHHSFSDWVTLKSLLNITGL